MKQRHLGLTLLVLIGGAFTCSPLFAENDSNNVTTWQTGLSFSYLTGDYGQENNTDIFYTAATVKRYFGKGDLTLIVPYLDITADNVAYIDGQAETVEGATGGSGLGDITLKGRYYAVEQDGLIPYIDLVGCIKFPTADENKGLGTGETDFTLLAEFTRRLDEKWLALGELGYTFVGKPEGYDVKNRYLYSIGLAYKLNPKLTLSGYLDGRTAIFEGNENPLSVLLGSEYKIRPDLRLDTLIEIGMNNGAPDLGITLGLRKRF